VAFALALRMPLAQQVINGVSFLIFFPNNQITKACLPRLEQEFSGLDFRREDFFIAH
jgi:hypothetical protein